jgi:hypothetical protein
VVPHLLGLPGQLVFLVTAFTVVALVIAAGFRSGAGLWRYPHR